MPGIGRLTVRASRLRKDTRDELDLAITRAVERGELGALRLLKNREVTPLEFLEAHRKGGVAAVQVREPLEPLVRSWLASGGLRPSSVNRYEQSWRFLFASLPGSPTLDDITPRWWMEFVRERGKVVASATLNRDRAALLAFRTWAKGQRLKAPELVLKKLEEQPKRSEILQPGELERIKGICRPDRWPLFWTLLETGARQGEVLNLKGSDIDQSRPLIQFLPQNGSKGRKARYVPCSAELHNYLRTIAALAGDGRLFPYERRTPQTWWADLAEKAGITGVTLHGLRATFITRALDAGVAPVDVQKLVGHSDITMTMRYYRNPKESSEAAEKIREAVGLQSPGHVPVDKSV